MTKNYEVNSYLIFDGRCEEAIEFYRQAIKPEQVLLARYKEMPPEAKAKARQSGAVMDENKIMHARLRIGESMIFLSDGHCSGKFDGFRLALRAPGPAEAERLFTALSAGGTVDMPVNKTFFSPAIGMLTDRFGVKWMVFVERSS